jgi:hypothetical protein
MTSPSPVPAPAILVASTITWAGTPCVTDWVQPGNRPVEMARRAPSAVVMGTVTVLVGKLRVCAQGPWRWEWLLPRRPWAGFGNGPWRPVVRPLATGMGAGRRKGKKQAPLPVPSRGWK